METNSTLLKVIAWENPGRSADGRLLRLGGGGEAVEVIEEVEADKLSSNYSNHH